jgi:hypothetical protein
MKDIVSAKLMFILSVIAVVFAILVSLFHANLWFAGTQWMLIAILLSVWALFLKKK